MTLRDASGRGDRAAVAYTATEEALVTRLQALSTELAAAPDEDFRAATRSRLVAMAAVRSPAAEAGARRPLVRAGAVRRLLAGPAGAPATRRRSRLTAGLAGAALTVTALGGLLAASQGAGPGDLLYDVKRGGEQTQLALAGDSRRGVTLLGFASTRLDELEELVGVEPSADAVVGVTPSGGEAGLAAGPDTDLVRDTLQTMDAQTAEGTAALTAHAVDEVDADALDVLADWTAEQQSGLGGLVAAMPAGAEGALATARELVGRVAARGAALQGALGCAGGPATAGSDELGPRPAECPALPPATTGAPGPGTAPPATEGPSGAAPAGTSAPTSAGGTGTAPAQATGAAPTPVVPGATGGGALPTTVAPPPATRPGPPLPSLPSVGVPQVPVPSVSLPGLPGLPGRPTATGAAPSSPGAVISVPPVVPGVSVCAPPLVTLGC